MDAPPMQWLQATRAPSAATPQHGQRVDDASERQGTARLCMCAAPLSGCRQAPARGRRTTAAWAIEVAQRLATREAECEEVTRVGDNRNTHPNGAVSEALEPERARADINRITCCSTPQHGRWRHVAAGALSCLTSQCLSDRRLGELPARQTAIATWSKQPHAKQRGVDWQCRIENARGKLQRLYPKMKA
jgi:hypothetical protein